MPTVIRRVEVAEEDAGSRVLNRHLPAWVISGALHVAVIGCFLLVLSGPTDVAARTGELVSVEVAEPKEEDPILTNPDVGFVPDLAAANAAAVEADANVTAHMNEGPPGLENQPETIAPQTVGAGLTGGFDSGVTQPQGPDGLQFGGAGGSGSFAVPGMQGRSAATRTCS